MSNYEFFKLNEICNKITDGSHYSPKGIEEGIPMLSVKDMLNNGFSYENCKYISESDYLDLVKSDCKPLVNDILIAKDGSYLKHVFVIKKDVNQAILSSIGILRPNLKIAYPEYLKYYLQTHSVKETVSKKYVSGSALPRIILKNFGEIDIIKKSLSTQKQIAKVLSDLDAKIEINNKINQELEAMAKTLYDYWFVQFDFPDKNGKPYKSSGGLMVFNAALKREIPVGWKSAYLNDLYDFKYGLGNTNPNNGGLYPVYGSNGVIGSYDKFNNEDAPVIGHIGNKCGSLVYAFGKHYVTYNGVMCKIKEPYDKFFGYTTLLSKDLMSRRRGSSQPFISYDLLNDIDFIIPDNRIMKMYCDLIIPSFEKIISNLKQNQKLSELRDWLLPMLMNGQVSVGYAAQEVENLGLVAEENEEYN